MPHSIVTQGEHVKLVDVLDVDRDGRAPGAGPTLVRVVRAEGGDAVFMTTADATRDGSIVPGNLGVVPWGKSALLRADGVRVDIAWLASIERRPPTSAQSCRICFGAFDAECRAVICLCGEPVHPDCYSALISCPCCGAPPQEIEP